MKSHVTLLVLFATLYLTVLPCASLAEWERHVIDHEYRINKDCVVLDFDQDGDSDLINAGVPIGESQYWKNTGTGWFVYGGLLQNMYWCDNADFDNDGDEDLAAIISSQTLAILVNNGSPSPDVEVINSVDSDAIIGVFDVDLDGDMDLVGGYQELIWYENMGGLQFEQHLLAQIEPVSVDVADTDMDGDNDIVAAIDNAPALWFENDGAQNFTSQGLDIYPPDWDALINGDLDGDGDPDLVAVGGVENHNILVWYRNLGSMQYSLPNVLKENSRLYTYSAKIVDLDQDGDNDIVSGIWRGNGLHFWKNTNNGTFSSFPIYSSYCLHDFGDLNGDGRLDVAILDGSIVGWMEQPPLHALTADLAEDGEVTLDWAGGSNDLIEFRVYRDSTFVGSTQNRVFTDQLPAMDTYTYRVVARFTNRPRIIRTINVSWPRLTDIAVTHDGAGNIQLNWEPDPAHFGGELDEFVTYRIFRNNQYLTSVTNTSYVDQLPGMGYYDYRIAALFDNHEVNMSNPAGVFWTDTDFRLYEDFNDTFHRTWTVANTSATNTWNWITDGDVFPTPFVRESGPPGCRLTSPPVDISGLSEVEIRYDWRMWERYNNGEGDSFYAFGPSGPWYWIRLHADEGGGTESLVLNGNQIHGDTLWLSFRARYVNHGPGLDEYHFVKFAVDNVTVGPVGAMGDAQVVEHTISADPALNYEISGIIPNPFNAATTITVTLPETSDLSVTVYNIAGQQVAELANGSVGAGTHQFSFDASQLASGLYFVRAAVPGQLDTIRKLMLVR
ncbi:T9SS type A sorting domain-containing protein [bacterium]|nr:T9SS type A sorting domain-containing protein [bacterium]